ncbi:hypothetical protein EST38_g10695 [Candolleomyces aberdarensis]|uniref:mannan endo-1,4-beta-mannosidase n=1 Tax=Candolleomyces aberdarensis TaxID=2316362 RepID=A0A4Q2D903_9AGAR|nr:hypothetical protein EST38_g10695 [Candolleomyces aberdarensis]
MFLRLQVCLALALHVLLAAGRQLFQRDNATASAFVTAGNGIFQLNGKYFRFYGTNAYWAHMTTDYDLDMTFHDMATIGFKVVRTWAFNDVPNKPQSGPYFQILNGGKATINEGADGLQRLDKLVAAADRYGIKLILTLTNNWNPERQMPAVAWNRRENSKELPRGYLQNDYGGIDAYVRNFHPGGTHDLFYTDRTIIEAFKNYVKVVVTRYAQHPAVMAWELGNDLRCSSTLKASNNCNPQTITRWAAEISKYIKELDHKHLVTTGDAGFYCLECPKLFAKTSTPKRPALEGPSFDGSYGIDTEDLVSIPSIDFGSLQIAPEQIQLFPVLKKVKPATQAIGDGGKWIEVHSQTSILLKKPEALLSSGIVPKSNWKYFVPNDQVAFQPDGVPCHGVERFQVEYSITYWASGTRSALLIFLPALTSFHPIFIAAINGNVDGVLQANWLQDGITSHGTTNPIWDRRAKRQAAPLGDSPQNGYANEPRYEGAATGQTAEQFASSAPPV